LRVGRLSLLRERLLIVEIIRTLSLEAFAAREFANFCFYQAIRNTLKMGTESVHETSEKS